MLTIVYLTFRVRPHIEWFVGSLHTECKGNYENIRLVIVDYFCPKRIQGSFTIVTPPKPCVWQGPHRATKENWFAASNARNTGLCFAPDGFVAFVDDLSVLLPGWLACVREAERQGYVVLGTYQKVRKLEVENGRVVSFEEFDGGLDSRRSQGNPEGPVVAAGSWLYGCSCAMPVQSLLEINGWPELLCDGAGGEDCACGMALERAGSQFRYDMRMKTLESDEGHGGANFRREDWHFEDGKPVLGGIGRDGDKSHAIVAKAMATKRFENGFDIAEMRKQVLAGGDFPIPTGPETDWFTGMRLSEIPIDPKATHAHTISS